MFVNSWIIFDVFGRGLVMLLSRIKWLEDFVCLKFFLKFMFCNLVVFFLILRFCFIWVYSLFVFKFEFFFLVFMRLLFVVVVVILEFVLFLIEDVVFKGFVVLFVWEKDICDFNGGFCLIFVLGRGFDVVYMCFFWLLGFVVCVWLVVVLVVGWELKCI